MNDLLELADKYRSDVTRRAVAHELSSEWHRHRGTLLGSLATVLSAVVGTSVFTAAVAQLKAGTLPDLSTLGRWQWAIVFVSGLILVLSPVITGAQAYLRHPE